MMDGVEGFLGGEGYIMKVKYNRTNNLLPA